MNMKHKYCMCQLFIGDSPLSTVYSVPAGASKRKRALARRFGWALGGKRRIIIYEYGKNDTDAV